MKKKILISTGGSGGHVIPAMILQKHLNKNYDVIISTDTRGLIIKIFFLYFIGKFLILSV